MEREAADPKTVTAAPDPFDDTWVWGRGRKESEAEKHARLFPRRTSDLLALFPRERGEETRPQPVRRDGRIVF